jgi:hypothetical protein
VIKIVAERGRLIRRIDRWSDETRDAYSQMYISRARADGGRVGAIVDWASAPEMGAAGPVRMGFMAAQIPEQVGGVDAYAAKRSRRSAGLVEQFGLD